MVYATCGTTRRVKYFNGETATLLFEQKTLAIDCKTLADVGKTLSFGKPARSNIQALGHLKITSALGILSHVINLSGKVRTTVRT